MIYLRGFIEELRIGLEETWNYRMNFISEIITMVVLYISLIFMNSGNSLTKLYSTSDISNRELILIGYMLWSFSIMAINTISDTIACESTAGTLEHKYMSIIPIEILNIAIFIQSFIIEALIVGVILIISKVFLGISISFNLISIGVILITLIGMYGMGMILGGVALKEKKIGKIVFIIQVIFLFVSDTITDISSNILISKIIPLTLGNDLLREAIIYGNVSLNKLLFLILISILWVSVGIIIFKIFEKKAKKDGILGYY